MEGSWISVVRVEALVSSVKDRKDRLAAQGKWEARGEES